jgi:hypothetical protein
MHAPVLRQAGTMLPRRSHPPQAAAARTIPEKYALGFFRADRVCDQNSAKKARVVSVD